ncbi:MAG: FG-GAP repeat protein [Desulfocapsa sp.]|nr:FG-GAP repeat protein [Desulfocapsa sp.]
MKKIFLVLCFCLVILPSSIQATPSAPASLDDIPLVGRYTISATIGADQAQYHARLEEDKQIFHNQSQEISAFINATGLQINNFETPFSLSLSRYGYGETLSTVQAAGPHGQKNRVELQRGPITEWYVNGPLGLQQGFTLTQRPQRPPQEADSELHLTLAMKGLRGKTSPDGLNMNLFDPSNKTVMQYGGLTAFDAKGFALPARLAATDNTLHIYVDDRRADYPIVVDPLFQKARLTQDGEANDEPDLQLGWSVALNNDTVVVGARGFHDIVGTKRGTVYVYKKPDTGWANMTQTARLYASDGVAGDSFGTSVAINSTDNIIVVGAPGHDAGNGQVYLFIKPKIVIGGSRWLSRSEDAVLTNWDIPSYYDNSEFGTSVAIDNVSGAIVVGAPGYSSWTGGAYVFSRPGFPDYWETSESYVPSAQLMPTAGTNEFGKSVAINNNQIVVGAPGESDQGAAYFYKSSSWSNPELYDMKLESGDISPGDDFGYDVAVSGSTIGVGAPWHSPSGAVYLFKIPPAIVLGSLHPHTTKLLPANAVENAYFGRSVAMNDSAVVVGTPYQAIGGRISQGQIHLFSKGAAWPGTEGAPVEMTENIHLTNSDGAANDTFGWSVAIAPDNSLASGAFYSNTNGVVHQGSAYVFIANNSTEAAKLTASQNLSGDRFGSAVAVSGDTVVVGVPKHDTHGITDQGAAYVFTRQLTNWTDMTPVALLFPGDGAVGDQFGEALAISSDTVVVGAPYHDIGGHLNQGAAYIFSKPAGGWDGELSHTAKLSSATGTASDYFGDAVGIDGNTVIIGAPNEGAQGAVHLFDKPAGQAWGDASGPTTRLVASDGAANDGFGNSVSISGNTVVVGAPQHDTNGNGNQGAAYVFVEPTNGWESIWTDMSETAKLSVSTGDIADSLGESVAISGDTIVTGAPWHANQGAAFVFQKPGSTWTDMTTATAKLTSSDGYTQQQFGHGVAISGNTIICSTLVDNTEQGAAYLFRKSGASWTDSQESEKLVAANGQGSDWLGAAVGTDGETVIAGAPGVDFDLSDKQGAAYLFDIRNTFPWAMFLPAIVSPKQ